MIQITGAFLQVVNEWLVQEKREDFSLQTEIMHWRPEQSIPMDKACRVLEDAAALCPDNAPGLRMAMHVDWRHLGAFGRVLSNASTMEDMIYRYLTYEQLFYGKNLASIHREKNHIELSWRVGTPPRILSQLSIGAFAIYTKQLFPTSQVIVAVSFPQPANGEAAIYEDFFNCPVTFDALSTVICFNNQALNCCPHFSDGSAVDIPEGTALTSVDASEQVMLNHITQEVIALLPDGKATVKNIATLMRMSSRTLQRRLSNYPDGLRGLIDDIRYDKARAYLMDPLLNFSNIASLLGYSEQSAFNLAFRRWTDMTPGEWRAIQLAVSS